MGKEKLAYVLSVLFVVVNCKIPDYINVCPQNHQNLSACITQSITSLVPLLKTGIPELGVPSLEPVNFDTLTILGASSFTTNLTNVKAWGASNFKILKLTPTFSKNGRKFRFEVNIPVLNIKGNYQINTKLSFVELKGSGPFDANLTNCHFECILKGKKVAKDGHNHLNFEKMNCLLQLGKSSIFFENLFNGDPIIGRGINEVIEDNSDLLFEEAKPNIVSAVCDKLTQVANKITESFDFEELFP